MNLVFNIDKSQNILRIDFAKKIMNAETEHVQKATPKIKEQTRKIKEQKN